MNIKNALFQLLENTSDIVMITEIEELDYPKGPKIIYVNRAFTNLTEYRAEEIIGRTPRVLQGKDTDKKILGKIKETIIERKSGRFEVINYTKSGKKYWLDLHLLPIKDENGVVVLYGAIERDITNLKDRNEKLKQEAYTDKLTKVYNRAFLEDNYFHNYNLEDLSDHNIGVLIIDIDNFKEVNDVKGHLFGDKVLKQVSRVLESNCRKNQDEVIRYSGDEFILIYTNASPDVIKAKANNIIELSELLTGHKISVSIGGAFLNEKDKTFKHLIKRAEQALYEAKSEGKNCCVFQD